MGIPLDQLLIHYRNCYSGNGLIPIYINKSVHHPALIGTKNEYIALFSYTLQTKNETKAHFYKSGNVQF